MAASDLEDLCLQYLSRALIAGVMAAWGVMIAILVFTPRLSCSHGTSVATDANAVSTAPTVAGGENDLTDLLAWAINNSDPAELRRRADEIQSADTGTEDATKRRADIQALIAEMREEPTEIALMEEALAIAKNTSAPTEQRAAALTALRYLLEPIDNANNLSGMGGLMILTEIVEAELEPDLQAAAEYALGTAASNNPTVQQEALRTPNIILTLLKKAVSEITEVSEKALYALSSLIRNNHEGQASFYRAGGVDMLKQLLGQTLSPSQLRKVLNLITDLTHAQEVEGQNAFADQDLLKQLLELLRHPDHDIQERALLSLLNLVAIPGANETLHAHGAKEAVKDAMLRSTQLLQDADADYKEVLEHLIILQGDLDEVLIRIDVPTPDKSEL